MSEIFDLKKHKRIYRYIPMLIMMVIIFIFSAMPGDDSAEISGRFLEPILNIVKTITHKATDAQMAKSIHWLIRKAAHFAEYAVFGVSIVYAVYSKSQKKVKPILLAELIAFLYAWSDEIHQIFVPGRYMAVLDVCIDSSGALLGIVISIWIVAMVNRRISKKQI